MSELDICSRREADRLIRNGQVTVDGQVAMLAEKVPPNLGKDKIFIQEEQNEESDANTNSVTTTTTVVLNKPQGYVSGQAEHGHPPAIRLLTTDRLWEKENKDNRLPSSWKGYAPAGRLDLHSTGLLIFSSSGIVAKKLIHHNSQVSKEYIVDVEPANQVSKRERELDPKFELPKPPLTDLTPLLKGGRTLLGSEHKPLLPCLDAEWMEEGRVLRLVLIEGRKHHIRRLCREVLGYHVVKLQRVRIGPIELGDLPEGCWRPVTQKELEDIME